jgi:hypothetical protein
MKPVLATVYGNRNGTWIIPNTRDQSGFQGDCENEGAAYICGRTVYHAVTVYGSYRSHRREILYRGKINVSGGLLGQWVEIEHDELPKIVSKLI